MKGHTLECDYKVAFKDIKLLGKESNYHLIEIKDKPPNYKELILAGNVPDLILLTHTFRFYYVFMLLLWVHFQDNS